MSSQRLEIMDVLIFSELRKEFDPDVSMFFHTNYVRRYGTPSQKKKSQNTQRDSCEGGLN